MNQSISTDTLSRVDKLFLDQNETGLEESHQKRAQRGIDLVVGNDVIESSSLQLTLLTVVNLGVKCFAGHATVYASSELWLSPCLVPLACAATLGDAVTKLGGQLTLWDGTLPDSRHLTVGNAITGSNSIRLTFDGWRIAVGPAAKVSRMAERPLCPLASIASAAIGVGEIFFEFARIGVTATRRVVAFSLWRPDLPAEHTDCLGEPLTELPLEIGVFGLGHLGQAYMWCLSALPYSSRKDATILLCDDDLVEVANIETGALLTSASVKRLKTRVVAEWLEARGFSTRLLERRVDQNFRRTKEEPAIAFSGFDDNRARQWLSDADFNAVFDSGLGGDASNFDTIAFHAWPNPRVASEIWPLESAAELAAREARKRRQATNNLGYQEIGADECGRLLLAGKAVAVPFVGAVAACVVLAEMLKAVNGGPTFSDLKLRLGSLDSGRPEGILSSRTAPPIRGLRTQAVG